MHSSRPARFAWLLTILGSVACRASQTASPMPAPSTRLTVLASAPDGASPPATPLWTEVPPVQLPAQRPLVVSDADGKSELALAPELDRLLAER